jgi:hypothetical protein
MQRCGKVLGPESGSIDPLLDCVTGRRCDLELHRPLRLVLHDRRARNYLVAMACWARRWAGCSSFPSLRQSSRYVRFVSRMREGWNVLVVVEIEGAELLRGRAPGDPASFHAVDFTMKYVQGARTIARHLGQDVEFVVGSQISDENYRRVIEVADAFMGKRKYDSRAPWFAGR